MNRFLQTTLTIVVAAGISFVLTKWTSPAGSEAVVSTTSPITHNPAFFQIPSLSHPSHLERPNRDDNPGEIHREEESVADFKQNLEDRLHLSSTGTSATSLAESIHSELTRGQLEFPYSANASIECRIGICEIRISHPDVASAQKFQNALLAGKFLNRPEILNQENGCNLHTFSGQDHNDTYYVECREGRR